MDVLITGGSGFLGSHLIKHLREHGHDISILSRSKSKKEVKSFYWNPAEQVIDEYASTDADCIIHLAGANVGEGRWTKARKKEIIDSRVKSGELLYERLKKDRHKIKTFISASGVGIYGNTGDAWVDESSGAGNDFMSEVCKAWEGIVNKIASLGVRVVIIRMGIVLGKDGGALPVMARPVKLFVGSSLGTGDQYISWIHVDDACSIYLKAIEDETMHDTYNAVAPDPCTNAEFIRTLAHTLKRPVLFPAVPASVLKLVLGEKAVIVLEGQRVEAKRLKLAGFQFKHREPGEALKSIYG